MSRQSPREAGGGASSRHVLHTTGLLENSPRAVLLPAKEEFANRENGAGPALNVVSAWAAALRCG